MARLVFGSAEANQIARRPRPAQRDALTPIPAAENTRAPMTRREQYAARVLAACSFRPASFDKRFARDLAAIADSDEPQLTARQRATLWRLVYRYRRQIPDGSLVAEAQAICNGQRPLAAAQGGEE